jgi:hypothetical protein
MDTIRVGNIAYGSREVIALCVTKNAVIKREVSNG